MEKRPTSNAGKDTKENSPKHPHKAIENPETGEKTEGEIGSADKNSAAQNPERQKDEQTKEKI